MTKRQQLENLFNLDLSDWSEEQINYEYHREFGADLEENRYNQDVYVIKDS